MIKYDDDMFCKKRTSKPASKLFIRGFTIVELTMVVAIMAVLFTIGAANYRDYQRRQYLDTVVRQVGSDIKLARQLSLSGKKPVGCEDLDGYAIQVFEYDADGSGTNDADENWYRVTAICGNDWCDNNPGTDYCVKEEVRFPQGIEIHGVSGFPAQLVTFLSFGRGLGEKVKPKPTNDTAVINLRYPTASVAERTITIRPSGSIEID